MEYPVFMMYINVVLVKKNNALLTLDTHNILSGSTSFFLRFCIKFIYICIYDADLYNM